MESQQAQWSESQNHGIVEPFSLELLLCALHFFHSDNPIHFFLNIDHSFSTLALIGNRLILSKQ